MICLNWASRARVMLPPLLTIVVGTQQLAGASVTLTATKDTTLYEYHAEDTNTALASNGSGDFFSAGRSLKRSQIRRGLLQFDFSQIPAGAMLIEGSVRLDLYVVDVPRKDSNSRPIWLLPAPEGHDWGEGASAVHAGVSGAGSGAPAELGDTTWYHTMYDPQIHDEVTFVPNGQGFWGQPGALGDGPLDPAQVFGEPAGIIPSEIGPIALTTGTLDVDVQAWLRGAPNQGWMVLGDETVVGDDESSLRGFASREHENAQLRPQLQFEYLLRGDFNDDGTLDEMDISLLTSATLHGFDPLFDLNSDQLLDQQDRHVWVKDLKRTYFGDASLDGEFNSSDMTQVFQIGEYEDAQIANSTWSEGDWNGDLEFDSGDFVIAFQHGGYERSPRTRSVAVPEPITCLLAAWTLLVVSVWQRRLACQQSTVSPRNV